MDISPDDAAQALSDIALAQGRSHELKGYTIAGPILILWGLIWVVAYTAMGLLPAAQWTWIWVPLDIVGIVGTILMSRRRHKGGPRAKTTWRVIGGMALAGLFCAALFSMVRPSDTHVYFAFPGLLAGTIYMALGLARMTRYIWLGMAMIAASLVGFFVFPAILPFWMAATGGGGLILGGLLFRRA